MTTIAFRDGVLAGDTMVATENGSRLSIPDPKVYKIGHALVSTVGYWAHGQRFHRWAEGVPHWDTAHSSIEWGEGDSTGYVFLRHPGGTQVLEYDRHGRIEYVLPAEHYAAFGDGCRFALGAMHAGASALAAINAAIYHSVWTGGAVSSVKF